MGDIGFRCECGALKGGLRSVTPRNGIRYVCHCDDCQAFAHFLGKADEVMDGCGGTDVFQMPASCFYIAEGADRLACVQVTRRPLLRWYAACCRTPVANTYTTGKRSFMAVILHGFDPVRRDAVLGPVSGHCFTQYATCPLKGVRQVNIPAMIVRIVARLVGARLSGDYRNNPLFDSLTGQPISVPRQLTKDERASLDRVMRR